MDAESPSDSACAVCGRRLLPGETSIEFVTRDGERIAVCELCKPRAEAAGWLRPEDIEMSATAVDRERRRGRAGGVLGGLLARRAPARGEEVGTRRPATDAKPAASETSRPPAAADAPELDGTTVVDAVVAFNRSDHRRTVAGLTRTLGPPRATALVRRANGTETVRLTIAWEITWYQWEVFAAGHRHDVRESGKGDTIDQLGSDDRAWNLMVAADGTLEEKSSAEAPVEES
jgi:hypothetical protein